MFVEVKTRADAEFGTAAEAVTPRKQRQLTRMAYDYLARERVVDRPCRFDVVTVMLDGPVPVIEVYAERFRRLLSRGPRADGFVVRDPQTAVRSDPRD